METRVTPIQDLNAIECFKSLEPRKSGVFKDKKRHNAYFDDSQALHIINQYVTKFQKSPTKTTEIQEIILELSGYIKPVVADTTPATLTPDEKVDKYVTDFWTDAVKFTETHKKTPTLEEIKLKIDIDVNEQELKVLVLDRLKDIPVLLNPVAPKPEVKKAPF